MKSDVSNIQLKQKGKVSYAEYALLAICLIVANKVCTLPSVLAGVAGSKSVWSVMILTATECGVLFFATQTAKRGGILALDLQKEIKLPVIFLFLLFFAMKLTAFSREIGTYYALSLFENVPVLPMTVLLILACVLLARTGYATLGRMLEIFVWLFLFVFLFAVIFTRTEGDLFNALAIFSPDVTGMGMGVYRALGWFGDTAIIAFLDLRGDESLPPPTPEEAEKSKKARGRILFAALTFSSLLLILFYALFTAVYGNAAKMTDYAFIKLSAFKANTDELGSADWPVIILWAILSTHYLALLFLSAKECLSALKHSAGIEKGKEVLSYLLLSVTAVLFSLFFLDEEREYEHFMTQWMPVASILSGALTVAVGNYALYRNKKEVKDEESK